MIEQKAKVQEWVTEDWGNQPQARLCLDLIDWLDSYGELEDLQFTLGSLGPAIRTADYSSEQILDSLGYLAGERINLLRLGYEFEDSEGRSFEISPEIAICAFDTGVLIHPELGIEIGNAREFLSFYFLFRAEC
jgi:hypothetical protein